MTLLSLANINTMKMVTMTEALAYGFMMMGYFGVIGLISIGCITTGIDMIQGNNEINLEVIIGSITWSFGVLFAAAGTYGATYKLIADAVMKASEQNITYPQNKNQLPTGLILTD
mgnify:CR=1 FL=1